MNEEQNVIMSSSEEETEIVVNGRRDLTSPNFSFSNYYATSVDSEHPYASVWAYTGQSGEFMFIKNADPPVDMQQSKSVLRISRNAISVPAENIIEVRLNLRASDAGVINVAGIDRAFVKNSYTSIDLTEEFCSGDQTISLEFLPVSIQGIMIPMYGENAPFFEVSYYTAQGSVQSLKISCPPFRTLYAEGEAFDRHGMQVEAVYAGNIKSVVEDYTVSPANALESGTEKVTVSYEGKSVEQDIEVVSLFDAIGNKNISSYDCLDNPKINLKTGRALLLLPDLSIGVNSYEIGVSHVYNSQSGAFEQLFHSCGKGWKLDMEQCLLKEEKNGQTCYKYIDGPGYVHTFELFDEANDRYFDVDDPGSVLEIVSDGAWLKDEKGNGVKFKQNGKIDYTMSALNPNIKKKFEHDLQGRVSRIYDTRRGLKEYLSFSYRNSDGLLESITHIYEGRGARRMKYAYDADGYLIATALYSCNDDGSDRSYKLCNAFAYDDEDQLTLVANQESKGAAEISYQRDRAVKVSKGIVKGTGDRYAFSRNIADDFMQKTYMELQETKYRTDGSVYEVSFTNERDVTSVIQFNHAGKVISTFEKSGQRLVTLDRESGISVFSDVISSGGLNKKQVCSLISGKYTAALAAGKLSRSGETEYIHYNCSFYLRLAAPSDNRLRAVLSYAGQQTYAEIDRQADGVWQKVSLPLSFSSREQRDGAVSFEVRIENFAGEPQNGEITCMYMTPGGAQEMFFSVFSVSNVLAGSQQNTVLSIVRSDGTTQSAVGEDVYLTQNDLMRAITSPVRRSGADGNVVYDLVCNNGGKRIANVQQLNYLRLSVDLLNCSELPDVYFQTKAPDNKSYTRQYFEPIAAGDKTQLIVRQEVSTFENGIGGGHATNDKTSVKSVRLDEYGRTSMESDSYGVLTVYEYETDENLDECGLVKSRKLYAAQTSGDMSEPNEDDEYMLLEEHRYDADKAYPEASTDGITSQGFVYDKRFSQLQSVQSGGAADFANISVTNSDITGIGNGLTTSFRYNDFRDQVLKVSETDGKTTRNNILTYENGALRTVTDGQQKYGIVQDIVNDRVDYTAFNGGDEISMLTKKTQSYTSASGESGTVAEYHNTEDEVTGTSRVRLDKYGRMIGGSYTEGEQTKSAICTYQTGNGESGAASKLEKIADGYEGRTYIYNYDYNNALTGWECRDGVTGDNYLNLQQISSGETKYSIGKEQDETPQYVPEKYKTQIIYDTEKTIEPRIVGTKNYYDSTVNDDDKDWKEIMPYSKTYEYDDFGRLKKTTRTVDISPVGNYTERYTYKMKEGAATPLLEELVREGRLGASNVDMSFTLGHDDKGRVTTYKETFSSNIGDGDNYVNEYAFEYDEFGHVTKETRNGRNNEFTYDAQGHLIYAYGSEREYYTSGRNKGRLQSANGEDYEYDNYGNRKAANHYMYGDTLKTYEYERGNLLKKFTEWGRENQYFYNHQGIRYEKRSSDGVTTKYYLDGAKILGEDRTDSNGNVKKLRYFYDAQGLCGFSYKNGDGVPEYYTYVYDLFGNVLMIENSIGQPMVRYDYRMDGVADFEVFVAGSWMSSELGASFNLGPAFAEWQKCVEMGNLNPFRWKGHYYDAESGYYYINSRYYDPYAGVYVDADDPENIGDNAGIIGALDRNAITLDNYLTVESNDFDVFPSDELAVDLTYDPYENVTWWERNWIKVVNLVLQIVRLIINIVAQNWIGVVFSVLSIIGTVADMILSEVCPAYAKVAGGLGTIGNGANAIATGLGLIGGCNPVTFVIGIVCILVGAVTMRLGINEVINGATGVNYLREWTGMSQEDYDRLYLATNIACTVCTIVGELAMPFRNTCCFMSGTLVLTAAGLKKIEEIREGDLVLAYDEETGEQAYKPVVRLFRNESKDWVGVTVNGKEIISTPGHKYYLPETKAWVSAEDLKVGYKVLTSDGEYATIEAVRPIHYETPQTTYNFEVEGFHTYYVGNGVLVHNMNGADCGGRITNKEATKVAKELGYTPTNYTSKNGAKIFTNGKNYISADVTSHNGGFWKMADSVKGLNSKATRIGTYDKYLKIRIGD